MKLKLGMLSKESRVFSVVDVSLQLIEVWLLIFWNKSCFRFSNSFWSFLKTFLMRLDFLWSSNTNHLTEFIKLPGCKIGRTSVLEWSFLVNFRHLYFINNLIDILKAWASWGKFDGQLLVISLQILLLFILLRQPWLLSLFFFILLNCHRLALFEERWLILSHKLLFWQILIAKL